MCSIAMKVFKEELRKRNDKCVIRENIQKIKTRKQVMRYLHYNTNLKLVNYWFEINDFIKRYLPKKYWKNTLLDIVDKKIKR